MEGQDSPEWGLEVEGQDSPELGLEVPGAFLEVGRKQEGEAAATVDTGGPSRTLRYHPHTLSSHVD